MASCISGAPVGTAAGDQCNLGDGPEFRIGRQNVIDNVGKFEETGSQAGGGNRNEASFPVAPMQWF